VLREWLDSSAATFCFGTPARFRARRGRRGMRCSALVWSAFAGLTRVEKVLVKDHAGSSQKEVNAVVVTSSGVEPDPAEVALRARSSPLDFVAPLSILPQRTCWFCTYLEHGSGLEEGQRAGEHGREWQHRCRLAGATCCVLGRKWALIERRLPGRAGSSTR